MTHQVKIVKEGSEPPNLIVVHYGNGEERHIVPDQDVFILVTPLEACVGGDKKELDHLLAYTKEVVLRAIAVLSNEVPPNAAN